jgi:quinol monooxygenase YgiN
MSHIALVVEFDVKPEHRGAFEKVLAEHAAGTLQDEEGCVAFKLLIPTKDDGKVFLYEEYTGDDAVKAHMDSSRLANTRAAYEDMINGRRIIMCTTDG